MPRISGFCLGPAKIKVQTGAGGWLNDAMMAPMMQDTTGTKIARTHERREKRRMMRGES